MARKKTKSLPLIPHTPALDMFAQAFVILLAVLVVYIPAMTANFIWDDDQLLTVNPAIPSPSGLYEFWFAPKTADYFPLTSSVLWLEYRLWGRAWETPDVLNGYHIVNILLHALAAMTLWRVLLRLAIPGAWLAALIFAVHPICVESVAWVSELKNTLSQIFFFLTLIAFFDFEKSENQKLYIRSVIFFCLSLLAKTSVVMMPFVLLLAAWWQRGKIERKDIMRTIPFFAAAFVLGVVTIYFQYGRAIGQEVIPIGGFMSRLANAGMAVWFYLGKMLWPLDLLVIYPRWNIQPPALWEFWGCAALVAGVALCWRYRNGWGKNVLFGFGYFVLTILPAIGFLKMSYMRLTLVADHFQYLSMVGVIALLVGTATFYYRKAGTELRPLFISAAVVIVVGFSWLTWNQASIYRGEETLWANTLRKNSDSWQAHNHYGAVLYQKGQVDEAMFHFSEAVRLKPENPESHNNYGLALTMKKREEEGIAQYREAVRIKGDEPAMRTNLANALTAAKHYDEAIVEYQEVLKMNPNNAHVYCDLGYALIQTGRLDEAIASFQTALKIAPGMPIAKQNLDTALQMKRNR